MDVLFAVLPFAALKHPSLGVSLLKAHALRKGLKAEVAYFNFQLAEWIGQELYETLELGGPSDGPVQRHSTEALIGEWFFADLVFGDRLPPPEDYIFRFVRPDPARAEFSERIFGARSRNREYIEHCVETIARRQPRVVGLTTTFDQTCACIAVAQRLKKLPTPPLIVMGGANCEGEMGFELARAFPCVDYVCTGEGDAVFPALLEQVFDDAEPSPITGLVQADGPFTVPSAVKDLDELPLPDFDDYFRVYGESSFRESVRPEVLFETSRGCWWGAKQHCTFCGLNGNTMAYRSKSAEKVIEELREVCSRYDVHRIQCVDNILDMNYFRTFFPRLLQSGLDVDLFFDTKANLKLEHVRMLRQARVRSILPGIESFSNPILRLMRKGSTGAQNIQVLRWCTEFEIHVIWTFLYGFPGEPPEEYARMAELVPLLTHLQPPSYCLPVQLDRFSPYFNEPERFGIQHVRPTKAYGNIFPFEAKSIWEMAYFFDFEFQDRRDPVEYAGDLIEAVSRWSQTSRKEGQPRLDLYQSADVLYIRDSRQVAIRPLHVLDGLSASVYSLCDSVRTLNGLSRTLVGHADLEDIKTVLQDLVAARLMAEIDGQFISLAIPRNRPASKAAEQGQERLVSEPGDPASHLVQL